MKNYSEEPVPISNISDLEDIRINYSPKQRVSFCCEICSKTNQKRIENLKSTHLFCTKCAKQFSWKNRSPEANEKMQLKKVKTMQKHFGEDYSQVIGFKKSSTLKQKDTQFWQNKLQKQQKTCLEKYGVSNPGASKQARQKAKKTSLQRYGVEYFTQNQQYQQQRKEKCLQKYGVKSILQTEDFKKHREEILLQKYGTKRALTGQYIFEDEIFDSSWELAVWIWAKDTAQNIIREPVALQYKYNGKEYNYYPDFKINDKLIEVKGEQFFENNNLINPYDRSLDGLCKAKQLCAQQNNVTFWRFKDLKPILNFVNEKYGKGYLRSFKKVCR